MGNEYPYVNEPTHDSGTVTIDASNKAIDTAVQSDQGTLKRDVADEIFVLEPNLTPLSTLLTSVGRDYNGKTWNGSSLYKKVAGNPKFEWLEQIHGGTYAKVSGIYAAAGAVTITVSGAGSSSAYIFTVGDVIMNFRTGERMLVATIASATTITVASDGRAFGTTAAAAGQDSDGLYRIGNANEEGSVARNTNTVRPDNEYNYTQIFKKSIEITGTAEKTDNYGGPSMPMKRRMALIEHAREIEEAFWKGERKLDQTGTMTKPRRTTGGVLEFLEAGNSYVQDQNGPITAPDFEVFLREGFAYGEGRPKTLFCGGVLLSAISEFSRGQLVTKQDDTTYGVAIKQFISPHGTINIVSNPLFVHDFAGYGVLLDLPCFGYRYLPDRDTKLEMGVQPTGSDMKLDQYITECGLERKLASRHALIKGVTS